MELEDYWVGLINLNHLILISYLNQCSSTFVVMVHPYRYFDELMHPIYLTLKRLRLACTFLAINRQPLEPESCSNPYGFSKSSSSVLVNWVYCTPQGVPEFSRGVPP